MTRQSYGRNTLEGGIGQGAQAIAAPETALFKQGGVTIDWDQVDANSGDVTLDDETVIPDGYKYIRYGTVISKITTGGKYAPADTGGSGGVEVVTSAQRGKSFILNETVVKELDGDVVGGAFYAGLVFRDRLNLGYSGAPTEANIEAMFPMIQFAEDVQA